MDGNLYHNNNTPQPDLQRIFSKNLHYPQNIKSASGTPQFEINQFDIPSSAQLAPARKCGGFQRYQYP